MPRIEAENIEKHIRLQTERILAAAGELFGRRGYRDTDMGDIAKAVGLARNSLYRYYPNKDHILLACLERDMGPSLDRIRALENDYPDPRERLQVWLDLQLQIAEVSCHGAMQMVEDIRANSPQLRKQISALHEPPEQVLHTAVGEILNGSGRDAELVGGMISSMVRSAAATAMRTGKQAEIRAELGASVARVLES
jgi:AcrR family transcriptional regulator